MEKVVTIDKLIIVPNTMLDTKEFPYKYIISARGFTVTPQVTLDYGYYLAGTNVKSVYEHFWNNALSMDDKVPAITHMLAVLWDTYGIKFGYLYPNKPASDDNI
jgi:hypothetical protein